MQNSQEEEFQDLVHLIEDYLATDQSQDLDTFYATWFPSQLFTRDEVQRAIRHIGGAPERRLLHTESFDGRNDPGKDS
jgi:hypothetical protein